MSDACAGPVTVTVTQTILQGAATSTTDGSASSALTTGEPTTASSDASTQASGTESISIADLQASPAFGLLSVVSHTTLTTMAPPTTLTLNLVHATPTSSSSTSTSAKSTSTSSDCPKPTASKAASSDTPKPSTPPGTIAGGVIGSMAGLALFVAILLYCCRRKRNFTFKRKVQKVVPNDRSTELEAAQQDEDEAMRQLEQARLSKPLPTPRSFDFGLPKINHSTSPVMPQRWI